MRLSIQSSCLIWLCSQLAVVDLNAGSVLKSWMLQSTATVSHGECTVRAARSLELLLFTARQLKPTLGVHLCCALFAIYEFNSSKLCRLCKLCSLLWDSFASDMATREVMTSSRPRQSINHDHSFSGVLFLAWSLHIVCRCLVLWPCLSSASYCCDSLSKHTPATACWCAACT